MTDRQTLMVAIGRRGRSQAKEQACCEPGELTLFSSTTVAMPRATGRRCACVNEDHRIAQVKAKRKSIEAICQSSFPDHDECSLEKQKI